MLITLILYFVALGITSSYRVWGSVCAVGCALALHAALHPIACCVPVFKPAFSRWHTTSSGSRSGRRSVPAVAATACYCFFVRYSFDHS